MKYLNSTISFVVFLLFGCSQNSEIDIAKENIKKNLKDPASTEFRSVKNYGNGVVCGEYNSKNSYGAYTGFKKFIATNNLILKNFDVDESFFVSSCKVVAENPNDQASRLAEAQKTIELLQEINSLRQKLANPGQ